MYCFVEYCFVDGKMTIYDVICRNSRIVWNRTRNYSAVLQYIYSITFLMNLIIDLFSVGIVSFHAFDNLGGGTGNDVPHLQLHCSLPVKHFSLEKNARDEFTRFWR